MEKRVLVTGASGALGLEMLQLLKEQELPVRALVFSEDGASKVAPFTSDVWRADASKGEEAIGGITKDITHIISALGKSVSLFTTKGTSFEDIDYRGNQYILEDALGHDVRRFIYISIKGADTATNFEIARVHKKFEDKLRTSGLDYTVVRPVGFFSGLNDLAIMAKRGVIPLVGDGLARTNSIHQKDLAEKVVSLLDDGPNLIEVGGPKIHTRREMAEMLQEVIGGKIVSVPEKLADWGMILPEIINSNMADKLDYFRHITSHDMIGEKTGKITFQDYLQSLDLNKLP